MKKESNCIFCKPQENIQYEATRAFAMLDKYPITYLHTLIIPKRHVRSYFDLTVEEHANCIALINVVRKVLCELDETITGFNIGVNDGEDAGQTLLHCHIHLIPRRKGDIENPTGGIRNIITKKLTI